MTKKSKDGKVLKTQKTYLGMRLLFVVAWFVLITLLSNSGFLHTLSEQATPETSNLIIAIVLLVPIAIAIFPAMYQMDNIYSTSPKKSSTPRWQRIMFGVVGTSVFLGLLLYLFTIIAFALFYRF